MLICRDGYNELMDDRITERVLRDDPSQSDDSTPDSFPHNSKKLLYGRVMFALPLMMLALIFILLVVVVINVVTPSFFVPGDPVIFVGFFAVISVTTLILYFNTRIRRRHKLVTGGMYGFMGFLFLFSPALEVLSARSLPPIWKILLGIFIGGIWIRYAVIVVRSHYQEGAASWADSG